MAHITLSQGSYTGFEKDGILRFHGIPYAAPFERFAAPQPVKTSTELSDATKWGTICPQLPSRLGIVMGPMPECGPQDEANCGVLSIYAPSHVKGLLPVMVFVHGGGFVSGGSQTSWYDGSRLARDGDVVVVAINYRLGIFGFLPNEEQEMPPGCQDVIAGIEWVRDNISAFGGDPQLVTGVGQSAGAWHMQNVLNVRPDLIRRAILHSYPGGVGQDSGTRKKVRETVAQLLPAGKGPHDVSAQELLNIQLETFKRVPSLIGPFVPTIPQSLHKPSSSKKEVLIGWTKDDGNCFVQLKGGNVATEGPLLTDALLKQPSLRLSEAYRKQGHEVQNFEVVWTPAEYVLGATHCVELPLLLGTQEAWKAAPVIGKTPWEEWEKKGAQLRKAWGAFAKDGTMPGTLFGVVQML